MRSSSFWWLALLAVIVMENNWTSAAPSPQTEDMLKTLLELDRMYSAIARPRFGKRTPANPNFSAIDYDGQGGELNEWLPVRR
ncbi:hypothetical protein Trydic_g18851 [Trypoxylus dichotomus]